MKAVYGSKPIIGIATYGRNEVGDFLLPGSYVDSVRGAGGFPVLLPPEEDKPELILEFVDGLILVGGCDIDPLLYQGSHHSTIHATNSKRDSFELALARLVLKTKLPVLGICRGLQVLNVSTGGTLIPHIPDRLGREVAHRLEYPCRPVEHPVFIKPESRLAKLMGATHVRVASWHHQAVQTVSPDWQVVAHASDGLVEALEHEYHPWAIGVQWHPELSPQNSLQQQLFRTLVTAAMGRRSDDSGSTLHRLNSALLNQGME